PHGVPVDLLRPPPRGRCRRGPFPHRDEEPPRGGRLRGRPRPLIRLTRSSRGDSATGGIPSSLLRSGNVTDMVILLAGASGLLGSALRPELSLRGHEIRRLVRHEPTIPEEVRWDPASTLPDSVLEGLSAV